MNSVVKPDFSKVTHLDLYPPTHGDFDYEFDNELLHLAEQYLGKFSWNKGIREKYIGYILAEKLGIFLFRINKIRHDVDEWIWVIVGDIPPTYLTVDLCKMPSEALDGYIGAMEEWVDAAESGKSVDGLIPVNVEPTLENAHLLRSRLQFIDQRILPKVEQIEKEANKTRH